MFTNNTCQIHKIKTTIAAAMAILGITVLTGCAGVADSVNASEPGNPQEQISMRQKAENASFSWLQAPTKAQVDSASINPQALSVDGQIIMGQASYLGESKQGGSQVFRWDIKNNQWAWLKDAHNKKGNPPIGINSTGDTIFGSQWVWQKDQDKSASLGPDFWAYALTDDGTLWGAALESRVVIRSLDGQQQQSWPAAELFNVDTKGHVSDQFWFAGNGVLVSTTVNQCLITPSCQEAYFTRWTPQGGKTKVTAQLPQEAGKFIQSNPGPQRISQNGLWLAGAIGQSIYLWDAQGQIKFLGGFESGGTVLGLSNDGQLAVGTAIDNKTNTERSWIWTATEGLGWLNEWLRDHGVAAEHISPHMQVKLLSADRRVLIGVTNETATPQSDSQSKTPAQKLHWWRVDMPERLRILM